MVFIFVVLLSSNRKITDYIFCRKEKLYKTSFHIFQMLFNIIFKHYKIIIRSKIDKFENEINKYEL